MSSSLGRIVLRMLVAFALAIGVGVVATATPASAATCYGSTCNGKDPSATGCDTSGASTVVWQSLGTGWSMELRNSSGCAARWTRWTNELFDCCWSGTLKIERQLWTPYGWYTTHVYTKTVYDSTIGRRWTPMVLNTSDDRHRSCLNSTCTAWYG